MLSDLFLQRFQYLLSACNVRLCLSRILFVWCFHVISPYVAIVVSILHSTHSFHQVAGAIPAIVVV